MKININPAQKHFNRSKIICLMVSMLFVFSILRASHVDALSSVFILDTTLKPSNVGGSASGSSSQFILDTRSYSGPFIGGSNAVSVLFTLDTRGAGIGMQLSSVVMEPNGTMRMKLRAPSDRQYDVEASTNLVDWVYLDTITATNEVMTFIDLNAAETKTKYYRAVFK